jgi:hypothetical protein
MAKGLYMLRKGNQDVAIRVALVTLSLLGVALVLVGTSRYGTGASPDSAN